MPSAAASVCRIGGAAPLGSASGMQLQLGYLECSCIPKEAYALLICFDWLIITRPFVIGVYSIPVLDWFRDYFRAQQGLLGDKESL